MFNKVSLKFVFGFMGILLLAMVVLVFTSFLEKKGVDDISSEIKVASNQI